jgi:hypothetical protein
VTWVGRNVRDLLPFGAARARCALFCGEAAAAPLALALMVIGLAACSGSTQDEPDPPLPTPSDVEVDPFADNATSLSFEAGQELSVVAGTPRLIRVQVQPPGVHTVRFALVGRQAQDAFLSHDLVPTKEDGIAETWLTVRSASSNFELRAAAGRIATARLDIVTLQADFGRLILQLNYPGHRTIVRWVASVHVGRTCADLQGPPFPDGPAISTSTRDSVQLERVPAGSALAAVVRAEQFAGGCRNITALRAGADTLTEIDIVDRPLQIGALDLRLAWSVDSTAALNPALDELAFRAASALTPPNSDDLASLLDVMSLLSDDPAAFEQARSAQSWRTVLVGGLAPELPGSGLRSMVHDWMRSGLGRLGQADAIVGRLSVPSGEGAATLTLTSVAELQPAVAGFSAQNTAVVSAETDDRLQVGTTLSWQPTPFLGATASLAAIAESPTTRSSAADGMAEKFGCGSVAELLAEAGETPGLAFAGCGQNCMQTLCRSAMSALWARVSGSNLPAVPWQISGASRAQIDGEARPTSLAGNWVGSLTVPDLGDGPIQGPFSGRLGD